ncbi:MAG: 4Fe-4S dicluster domain-containing protein [Deltaproteobacteria bacterium]|nr:4Fe-4S dicluster domain-containing protein [Deltaproteobacteria bacterium]
MTAEKNISFHPTDGLSYDPSEPTYWQPAGLQKELDRAFEICSSCRMCFKYCDSFPTLFKLLDERHEGHVDRLSAAETRSVMDACFQCKLCEVQCPYTPRDKHEFQLDFPKLVHRYRALHAESRDLTIRDRLLSDPDFSGKLARASFGLVNVMNRVRLNRELLHSAIGIHRDKALPEFASQTFSAWAKGRGKTRVGGTAEAVLFQTCYVENNEPDIGKDTLAVYEKNQIDTACVEGLRCCGMPAWESGNLEKLREHAHDNLDRLMPFVEAGAKVVVVNPTCSMMMRKEYPELLEGSDRERARLLAPAVRDAAEYLWSIRQEPRFSTDFKSTPGGRVACHAPCHLRAQAIGFHGRDLIKKIPGVSVAMTMECCGHDGTYAMKTESYEASKRIGQKAFDGMKQSEAQFYSTECPLAASQLMQHTGIKTLHPMSILARAYRPDGFPFRVPEKRYEELSAKPEGEKQS